MKTKIIHEKDLIPYGYRPIGYVVGRSRYGKKYVLCIHESHKFISAEVDNLFAEKIPTKKELRFAEKLLGV